MEGLGMLCCVPPKEELLIKTSWRGIRGACSCVKYSLGESATKHHFNSSTFHLDVAFYYNPGYFLRDVAECWRVFMMCLDRVLENLT